MIQLTKAQVLLLHKQLMAATGGDTALLNDGLLEAALCAPFQSYDGEMLFPSIPAQAARLGFGLKKIMHLQTEINVLVRIPCLYFSL